MLEKEPLVKNADNRTQVKKAERKERVRERTESDDLRNMMNSTAGSDVLWRILERCGAFRSVYNENPHSIYYNAGRQDLGHWLMEEMTTADPIAMAKLTLRKYNRGNKYNNLENEEQKE